MKKFTLIWVAIGLLTLVSHAQTTAIDFTLTDCDGNSRSLYPIIDSGNVVILVYEHQCSSCLVGAKNIRTAINTYYPTAKNIRIMYLDNGGYSCTSVKNWVSNNLLISGPTFAYSNNQSSPYGSAMPVIVVTGSSAHKAYVTVNSNVSTIKAAIVNVMTDISNGINTEKGITEAVKIYPNPVENDKVWLKFNNTESQNLSYEISNAAGQIIIPSTKVLSSIHEVGISVNGFENGIYFISLNSNEGKIVKKIFINRQ